MAARAFNAKNNIIWCCGQPFFDSTFSINFWRGYYFKEKMKKFITYWLYPILLFSTIGLFSATINYGWNLKIVFAWMVGFRCGILLLVEFLFNIKKEWKMTKTSFLRDLKWMASGIIMVGITKVGIPLLAIDLSAINTGYLANTSVFTGALITLLVYEFFQYWYHRVSHTGIGKFKWLWKIHVTHHLPKQVYLLMHPVVNPINVIVIRVIIIQGSLILMGASSESIFMFNALMGLQGLISHFNVEIKAGFLNYIFIGTELHRYHHSADIKEAQNYGSVLSIWDIVFGTFYYKPNRVPERLGVENEELYPKSTEIFKVLALPFKKDKTRSTATNSVLKGISIN